MGATRTTRNAGVGASLLLLLAGAGCSTPGSARTDYFAARSISHTASPGDGSVIAIGPRTADAAWTAELSFAPTLDAGEVAADSSR